MPTSSHTRSRPTGVRLLHSLRQELRWPLYSLVKGRAPERRFHAYGVGLPKTGTTTLGVTYNQICRSAHEPFAHDLIPRLRAIRDDSSSDAFLTRRDRCLGLEFEASHLLHVVAGRLSELFPEAKFVLTIREPKSWLASIINELHASSAAGWGPVWDEWHDFAAGSPKPLPAEERALTPLLTRPLEGYLAYWARHINIVLDSVPADRLLVRDVTEIDESIAMIHDFIGASDHFPAPKVLKSHTRPNKLIRLEEISDTYLDGLIAKHCDTTIIRLAGVTIPHET